MTPQPPSWLPPMIACDGRWEDVIKKLYDIFDRDFRRGSPSVRGHRLFWDKRKIDGGAYEEGFWHLITRTEDRSGERNPDFRRAERLPWCRPVIDHESDIAILVWDFDQGRKNTRTHLWLRDHDYVVVVQRRENRQGFVSMFLVTAYHVDGPSSRRKLERGYGSRNR